MSRHLRWAATGVPQMRREMVAASTAEMSRTDLPSALQDDLIGHLTRVAGNFRPLGDRSSQATWLPLQPRRRDTQERFVFSLRAADLFWVTGAMARVAMDAARDIPVLSADAAPTAHGVMVFETALPPLFPPVAGMSPLPVDAVSWDTAGPVMMIQVWARSEHFYPVVMHPGSPGLSEVCAIRVPYRAADFDELDYALFPEQVSLLALLASAWHLMMIPTLAERRQLDAEWGGRPTPQTKPDRLVTTIDLRPLRQVTTPDDDSDGEKRRLTVRHYVRGHWRNQAHGPGLAERRLVYVEPYIKGPADAPLVDHEKVMVWRR